MRRQLNRSFLIAFIACLSILASACVSGDDESNPKGSLTLSSASDATLAFSAISIQVPAASIGANADQLPLNASLSASRSEDASGLAAVQALASGATSLSPTYSISASASDGTVLSATTLVEPYRVTLKPNRALLAEAMIEATELLFVIIESDGSARTLTYSATPVAGVNYSLNADGDPEALVSVLGEFLLITGGEPVAAPPEATVLTGTLNSTMSVTTLTLMDDDESDTLTAIFPELLLAAENVPLSFDPSNFDTQNPTSPTNRSIAFVNANGTFTSSLVGGSATLTFTSINGAATTGTLSGTLADNMGATLTVNFTFTSTPPAPEPNLSQAVETFVVDAAATNEAGHAVVFNGTDFVTIAMSAQAGATRNLVTNTLAPSDGSVGTPETSTPTQNFVHQETLEAAFGNDRIFVVGEDSSDQSGNIVCAILDSVGSPLVAPAGIDLGAGRNPLVAYDSMTMRFAIAYETAAGVSLNLYDANGTLDVGPIAMSADTSASLKGLCTNNSGEALVTFSETTNDQLHAMRVDLNNGTLGMDITVDSTIDGGNCVFDQVGDGYLISHGGDGSRMLTFLDDGQDVLGMSVDHGLNGPILISASADTGNVMLDLTTIPLVGDIFALTGVTSANATPAPFASSYSPLVSMEVPTTFNAGAARPSLAAATNGRFLLLGRDTTNGLSGTILVIGDANDNG